MTEIDIKGSEMTHEQFKEFVKRENEWFESTSDILMEMEKEGNLLIRGFCDIYKVLLKRRLSYCVVCSEYYRAMAERSFWFMRGRVLKTAKVYESLHKMTLQELIALKTYMKLNGF